MQTNLWKNSKQIFGGAGIKTYVSLSKGQATIFLFNISSTNSYCVQLEIFFTFR